MKMTKHEIKYDGGARISKEDQERYAQSLTKEDIQELIKKLHFSPHGFSVGFSSIFNFIAARTNSKEEAYDAVDSLAHQLKTGLNRLYSGELEIEPINGVKTVQIQDLKDRMQ